MAAASSGDISKRATGRCFPSRSRSAWLTGYAKAVVGRYRVQQRQKTKRLRKRVQSKFNGQNKRHEVRKVFSNSYRSQKRALTSRHAYANGVRHLPNAPKTEAMIKKEPKTEPQTDMEANAASADLFRMCPLCAHWIRTDQLAAHVQTHVPNIGSMYRCNLCDYTASDSLLVRAHFLQEHQKIQVQQQQTHDAHQAAILMTYVNLCRGSSSTATAADG